MDLPYNVFKKELSTWYFGMNSICLIIYLDENMRYEGRSNNSKKKENTKKVLKLVFSISVFPFINQNHQQI